MIDLGLVSVTGDLDLSGGDAHLVSGKEAIAQNIGVRFSFQTGEWFLDRRVGAPIIGGLLGAKRSELEDMREICTQIVEEAPGVRRLTSLEIDMDAARNLTISWQAEGNDGEFLSGAENLIFEEEI